MNSGIVHIETPKTALFADLVFACLFMCLLVMMPTLSVAAPNINSYDNQVAQLTKNLSADNAKIRAIEKSIATLDRKTLGLRKRLRKERTGSRTEINKAKRDIKRQTNEIQRLQIAIRLIEKDILLTARDTQRSKEYYKSLNPFKRQLEAGTHKDKIKQNKRNTAQMRAEKATLTAESDAIKVERKAAEKQLLAIGKKQQNEDVDPKLQSILDQQKRKTKSIAKLRKTVRKNKSQLLALKSKRKHLLDQINLANSAPAPAAIRSNLQEPVSQQVASQTQPEFSSYVFAISGELASNIEDTLQLKSWVESYEATYIQAHWNGFEDNADNLSTDHFKQQFEERLSAIHPDANIILIGHGRGGGAAIEAATEVASKLNRAIEFLAVIDPIGDSNLRANIVYNNTSSQCVTPKSNSENDDRIINTEYAQCIKDAQRRKITSNIKHFYNRWQKDSEGPLDYHRQIAIIDNNGQNISVPTATGRFTTSSAIESDQKRVFVGEGKDAHIALLAQASKALPKLLLKHLR